MRGCRKGPCAGHGAADSWVPGSDAGHHMNDDAGTGGRWMTYDELAAMRGIKRIGAVRLVQRYKWRRQAGNDGRARVLVPRDALQPVRGTDAGTTLAGALAALEDAVSGLREQLDVANARAERVEADRADERLRTEAVIAAERGRADDLRDRLIAMQEQLADAHAALQAAEEAKALAGRAEQGRDQERGRADKAEAATAAERARADALRERIEALQEQLAAHQEGVDATETIRQAEAMVDNLREAHAGEVSALKTERHRLATQIDGFAARADQAEERTDSLRARVDVLQRERELYALRPRRQPTGCAAAWSGK